MKVFPRCLVCLGLALGWSAAAAQEGPDEPHQASDDDLRIRGVFNSVLPGTEKSTPSS